MWATGWCPDHGRHALDACVSPRVGAKGGAGVHTAGSPWHCRPDLAQVSSLAPEEEGAGSRGGKRAGLQGPGWGELGRATEDRAWASLPGHTRPLEGPGESAGAPCCRWETEAAERGSLAGAGPLRLAGRWERRPRGRKRR